MEDEARQRHNVTALTAALTSLTVALTALQKHVYGGTHDGGTHDGGTRVTAAPVTAAPVTVPPVTAAPVTAPPTAPPLPACKRVPDNTTEHCKIPRASLIVICIGSLSSSRRAFLRMQAARLGKYVTLYEFTEANTPECVVCNETHRNEEVGHPDGLQSKRNYETRGWWCAQKRPLLAAYEVLKRIEHIVDIPDFLMMIDDDTIVNPRALRKFIVDSQGLVRQGLPAYIGHAGSKHMAMGGGGTILTRAVLITWMNGLGEAKWAALRWCVEQTQSGHWCHWHSDWSYGICVQRWSGASVTDAPDKFTMNHPGSRHRINPRCSTGHVSCHLQSETRLLHLPT